MQRLELNRFASWLLLLAALSCGSADNPWRSGEIGALGLELTLPGGLSFEKVLYEITLGDLIAKYGSIPLDGQTRFSARIDGIPAATGYLLTVEAMSDDGRSCKGTAALDVKPNAVTSVSVVLRCPGRSSDPGTGTVKFEGVVNLCPVVDWTTATVAVDRLVLHAEARDDDSGPMTLFHMWRVGKTRALGSGADLSVACAELADVSEITLEVGDGDCADSLAVMNACE